MKGDLTCNISPVEEPYTEKWSTMPRRNSRPAWEDGRRKSVTELNGRAKADARQRRRSVDIKHSIIQSSWESSISLPTKEVIRIQTILGCTCNCGAMLPELNGIPGVNIALDPRKHPCRRIAWSVLIFVCTLISILEIADRINQYLQFLKGTRLEIVQLKDVEFPSLTLCPSDFEAQRYGVTGQHVNSTIADFASLWQMNFALNYFKCSFQGYLCEEYGSWQIIYTAIGMCFTYTSNAVVNRSGLPFGFRLLLEPSPEIIVENGEPVFKILIHENKVSPRYLIATQGIYMFSEADALIPIELYLHKITPEDERCNTSPKYRYENCMAACFDKLIEKNFNCSLRFMLNESISQPECTPSQMSSNEKLFNDIVFNHKTLYPNACTCKPDCESLTYRIDVDSISKTSGEVAFNMRLYLIELSMTVEVEYPDYDLSSLLADVGGITGLFLGACILTTYELLEFIVIWIRRKLGNKVTANKEDEITDVEEDPDIEPVVKH